MFAGLALAPHRVLAADSLAGVVADGLGGFAFVDTNASARNPRYYRAVSP
jgi:hypothetical protein